MALSLPKRSSGGTVGLDIDDRFLAAVRTSGGRVTEAASTELAEGVMRDGEVADRAGLSAALKRFAADHKLPSNVRLGISNQQIVVRVIELPPIEDEQQRTLALRYQAAETIAMPLDEAVLDHQVVGSEDGPDGPRMQVVLVAARRSMVEEFAAAAKDAGLRPDGIDLDAFALVRALASEAPQDDVARVFCHLGGVTHLAIAAGRSCFFTRTLSPLTDDLSAAGQLADDIRLSIDYYRGQPNSRRVEGVILSGPGAANPSLAEEVEAHLDTPVTAPAPLGELGADAISPADDAHRYTIAAGLALGAAA